MSKTLLDAETRYSTYDKEFLAVVRAVQHWRSYLHQRSFVVYSDHQPLKSLFQQAKLSNR